MVPEKWFQEFSTSSNGVIVPQEETGPCISDNNNDTLQGLQGLPYDWVDHIIVGHCLPF